jgi:hypothetical protein
MRQSTDDELSRREALGRLLKMVAVAGASAGRLPALALTPEHLHGAASNAATVSDGLASTGFFSLEQKATLAALADVIIPTDHVSPGAKAAKVEDYINFSVSQDTPETQQTWVEGLQALDQLSREQAGAPFTGLSGERQESLIAGLASHESSPETDLEKFFLRAKRITAEGFYTSKIGLVDDLKYQGNSYVDGPAGCQEQSGDARTSGGDATSDAPSAGEAAKKLQ